MKPGLAGESSRIQNIRSREMLEQGDYRKKKETGLIMHQKGIPSLLLKETNVRWLTELGLNVDKTRRLLLRYANVG